MTHSINWIDRLRIERAVWALDQRLYDLPRRSRIAKRHEVRENLLTAANDIGASEAMRNLGGTRELAAEYRDAEFGEGPRASWVAAATFLLTSQLLFTSLLVNGRGSSVGGAWTPLAWAIWILATVLVGRLWRVRFRRRDAATSAASSGRSG